MSKPRPQGAPAFTLALACLHLQLVLFTFASFFPALLATLPSRKQPGR